VLIVVVSFNSPAFLSLCLKMNVNNRADAELEYDPVNVLMPGVARVTHLPEIHLLPLFL